MIFKKICQSQLTRTDREPKTDFDKFTITINYKMKECFI